MSRYRLHIDIPLHIEESSAIRDADRIIGFFDEYMSAMRQMGVVSINYRLGHDDDRQKSNYLDKNGNGHVSNKKLTIPLQ